MAKEVVNYVIDACGLIAYFQNEEGSEKFEELFRDKHSNFFMHAVNIGEVYYDALKRKAKDIDQLWNDIQQLPITIVWKLNISFIEIVGKYKTSFRVSYADCFLLALAEQKLATVISTDHHELESIDKAGKIPVYWLR